MCEFELKSKVEDSLQECPLSGKPVAEQCDSCLQFKPEI